MEPFKINDEFIVIPSSNQVSNTVKLEPRLMKLLCLLIENNGNLVTREEIIEKIWEGYAGGDEGLTQAISFLRKALNDVNKEIIETVPKGGYIFRGRVAKWNENLAPPIAASTRGYISYKAAALAAVLLIMIFSLVYYFLSNKTITPRPDSRAPKAAPEGYTPKPQ